MSFRNRLNKLESKIGARAVFSPVIVANSEEEGAKKLQEEIKRVGKECIDPMIIILHPDTENDENARF